MRGWPCVGRALRGGRGGGAGGDSLCAGGGGGCGGLGGAPRCGAAGLAAAGSRRRERGGVHRGAEAVERLRGTRERGAERTEVTGGSGPGGAASASGARAGAGQTPLWIPGAGGGARGGTWAAPCPRRTGLHLVPSLCLSAELGPELRPGARREAGVLLGPSGDCLSGLIRPSAGAGPVQQQPRASPGVCKLSTKKPRRTG